MKKPLIFVLCFLLLSIFNNESGAEDVQTFDADRMGNSLEDTRANVEEFFHQFGSIENHFKNKSNEIIQYDHSDEAGIKMLHQSNELLEETIRSIEELPTPLSCMTYRNLAVDAYNLMIKAQKMMLDMPQTPEQGDQIFKLMEESTSLIEESEREYHRILDKHNIPDQEW